MSSFAVYLLDHISASKQTLKPSSKSLEKSVKKTKKIFKALFIASTVLDGSLSLACFSISAVAILTGIFLGVTTLALVITLKAAIIVGAIVGVIFFLSAITFGIAGIIRNKNYSKTPSPEKPSTSEELQTLKLTNDALINRLNEEFKTLDSILGEIASPQEKKAINHLISDENINKLNTTLNSIEEYLKEIIKRIEEENKEDLKEMFSDKISSFIPIIDKVIFKIQREVHLINVSRFNIIGKAYLILLDLLKYCNTNKKTITGKPNKQTEFETNPTKYLKDKIKIFSIWINSVYPETSSDIYYSELEYKENNKENFKKKLFETVKKLESESSFISLSDTFKKIIESNFHKHKNQDK